MIPTATYRLQLHRGFTFADAAATAPYLAALGVSHAYLSPIQMARVGSMHGYDVVDHAQINPELGGTDGFEAMAAALRKNGLGIILDIVPNHMAVGGGDNDWWLDVLRRGPASPFADHFDIDFKRFGKTPHPQLLAPFLARPYGDALRSGDLKLARQPGGEWAVLHHEHIFPLRPEDQAEALADIQSPDALHALLERQHFRLAWWRTANDQINWRRFFDITSLAGLRIERPEVFDAVHHLPLELYARGLIDGLRVDHVDGLADPAGYCRKLRAELTSRQGERPDRAWLVVEKILAPDEPLATDWGVDGTTGYDFMNEVSALQHDPDGAAPLAALWSRLTGRSDAFEPEEILAREQMLAAFEAQVAQCAEAFVTGSEGTARDRDLTLPAIRRTIRHLVAQMRQYRTYAGHRDALFDAAVARLRSRKGADTEALDFIVPQIVAATDGGRRFNQLAAPVAAKAVEDTAFYRYGRLLSRNDVGFAPGQFAMSAADFHTRMAARGAEWPHAMLATATHDHKRGEDARARLTVISEAPEDWTAAIDRWWTVNRPWRFTGFAPDDEYMLYQAIVAAWPGEGAEPAGDFAERIAAWQMKALREAKLRSSWSAPETAYEDACRGFCENVLGAGTPFRNAVHAFVAAIDGAARQNSLVQLALKCLLPGVPDVYQGAEYGDFSLVDPDNRRPVSFADRMATLNAADPWSRSFDGQKQALMRMLLQLRRSHAAFFASADYRPLAVQGARSDHVLAFQRAYGETTLAAAVCLRCAAPLIGSFVKTQPPSWWQDTAIVLDRPAMFRNALSPRRGAADGSAAAAFADLPVAVWLAQP